MLKINNEETSFFNYTIKKFLKQKPCEQREKYSIILMESYQLISKIRESSILNWTKKRVKSKIIITLLCHLQIQIAFELLNCNQVTQRSATHAQFIKRRFGLACHSSSLLYNRLPPTLQSEYSCCCKFRLIILPRSKSRKFNENYFLLNHLVTHDVIPKFEVLNSASIYWYSICHFAIENIQIKIEQSS